MSQTAATVRGMSRLFGLPRYAMIPLFMLPALGGILTAGLARASGHPRLAALFPLFIVSMAVPLLVPQRIRVGADGILTRWSASCAYLSIPRPRSGFAPNRTEPLFSLPVGRTVLLPRNSLYSSPRRHQRAKFPVDDD